MLSLRNEPAGGFTQVRQDYAEHTYSISHPPITYCAYLSSYPGYFRELSEISRVTWQVCLRRNKLGHLKEWYLSSVLEIFRFMSKGIITSWILVPSLQGGAVMTRSIFSKLLTIVIPQLAREGEVLGVYCEFNAYFFSLGDCFTLFDIVLYLTASNAEVAPAQCRISLGLFLHVCEVIAVISNTCSIHVHVHAYTHRVHTKKWRSRYLGRDN